MPSAYAFWGGGRLALGDLDFLVSNGEGGQSSGCVPWSSTLSVLESVVTRISRHRDPDLSITGPPAVSADRKPRQPFSWVTLKKSWRVVVFDTPSAVTRMRKISVRGVCGRAEGAVQ